MIHKLSVKQMDVAYVRITKNTMFMMEIYGY